MTALGHERRFRELRGTSAYPPRLVVEWMFFDSDPYGAWLDVVVTGLFVIAIAIPAICWLTWRRNADGARGGSLSFRDWAAAKE
jgi:hypothetical protein